MKIKEKSRRWAKLKKFTSPIVLATMVLASVTLGLVSNNNNASADIETWGPQDRPTFTWAEPADYVTFNSMTDNPLLGNERNFVRVREAGSTEASVDNIDVEAGKEYEVSIWFHNNAKSRLNKEQDGIGIAKNVRLMLEMPEIVPAKSSAAIKATISADNANPQSVWDMAFANTEKAVALRFVPNSAVIYLNEPGTYDAAKGGYFDDKGYQTVQEEILSEDALFNRDGYGGAMLSYWNDAWGTLPGCSEYSGYVKFRFKVDQPNFEMNKTVTKEGDDNYAEEITANPGDTLEFKIEYKNTGTTLQENIIAKDTLPEGLTYVEGSTYFKSSRHEEGKSVNDDLFNGGLNLGDFEPGDSMYITYKVKVNDDVNVFPCGDTEIYNEGQVGTQNGTGTDKTRIIVHRECNCATNPELPECQELPSTGPVEAAIALVVLTGIGGGGYFYYRTRKHLKAMAGPASHAGRNITNNHAHKASDATIEGVEKAKDTLNQKTSSEEVGHHSEKHNN